MKNYTRIALIFLLLSSVTSFGAGVKSNRHIKTSKVTKNSIQNRMQTLTPFFYENFSAGLPAGWQTIDNAGHGVNWSFTTTGISRQGSYPGLDSLSPTNTSAGNGYMIYDSDASTASVGGENADLITDAIDCSLHSNVHLFFNELLAHYLESATVSVSTDGTTWTQVLDASAGLAQNGATPNPNGVDLDISSIAANQVTVFLRFRFVGDYDYFWMIDDITLYEAVGTDAVLSSIDAPQNSCSLLSNAETVTVSIYNNGGTNINNFDINFIADNGAPQLENVSTTITPGQTLSFSFITTADFSAAGNHTLQVYISVLGDTVQSNDTANALFFTGPRPIVSPGYTNGFELTDDLSGFALEDLNNDSITWELSNVLPRTGTFCARINAAVANDYVYTSCFELVDTAQYNITFYYRATSTSTPTFFESVIATAQVSTAIVQTLSPLTLVSNLAYVPVSVPFNVTTTGTYYFGFHAVSGDSLAGLRLDDINITTSTGVGIRPVVKGQTVVYPNPSTGFIHLNSTLKSDLFTVTILNTMGQIVFNKVYSSLSSEVIDLSTQANGQYIVRVISDKGVSNERVNITK